jgi:hypothetical protein
MLFVCLVSVTLLLAARLLVEGQQHHQHWQLLLDACCCCLIFVACCCYILCLCGAANMALVLRCCSCCYYFSGSGMWFVLQVSCVGVCSICAMCLYPTIGSRCLSCLVLCLASLQFYISIVPPCCYAAVHIFCNNMDGVLSLRIALQEV